MQVSVGIQVPARFGDGTELEIPWRSHAFDSFGIVFFHGSSLMRIACSIKPHLQVWNKLRVEPPRDKADLAIAIIVASVEESLAINHRTVILWVWHDQEAPQ